MNPSFARRTSSKRSQGKSRQDGMVLIVALVLLLAMTLAGALLLRSVGAGLGVAGNLGFKQNATSAADRGIEAGRAWISADTRIATDLENNNTAVGYFATWDTTFNPLTYEWDNTAKAADLGEDGTGNHVWYVVHRLCSSTGPFNAGAQKCVMPLANVSLQGAACVGSDCGLESSVKRPYYRVTSKVQGPRNTVSYIQVVMF